MTPRLRRGHSTRRVHTRRGPARDTAGRGRMRSRRAESPLSSRSAAGASAPSDAATVATSAAPRLVHGYPTRAARHQRRCRRSARGHLPLRHQREPIADQRRLDRIEMPLLHAAEHEVRIRRRRFAREPQQQLRDDFIRAGVVEQPDVREIDDRERAARCVRERDARSLSAPPRLSGA